VATQRQIGTADGLAARFTAIRALTRDLSAPLSDADATIQPHPDASPAKWHLAHTTWFFETFVLRDHVRGYRARDERWAYLFNSYYEGEGDRHPRARRGMLSRPSLDEILSYRTRVEEALLTALPRLGPAAADLVDLGLQHEQQHQELLLMDMLAAMAENPLAPALWAPPNFSSEGPELSEPSAELSWIGHPGGIVEIGHAGEGFAFDCEAPRHRHYLRPFALADRPVTNGEWQAFMADGGYVKPLLWLADGWAWVKAQGIGAPLYWRRVESDWMRFGLDGLRPIDPDAPVCHISFYEADAFARWAGARLPTEAEWEAAAAGADPLKGHQLDAAGPVQPRPAQNAGHRELHELHGNVWEWTASAFLPYPGFRPAEGTVGEYNGKFMSGQMVLRGGSCATPRGHLRPSYRNFFYPHQRWMFAGLRLARDD
jgi:ergothioneine biosynthesis protein EgtB